MSNIYGQPGYGGSGGYLSRKVSFGWIGEAWSLFRQAAGVWITGAIIYILVSLLVAISMHTVFPPDAATYRSTPQLGPYFDLYMRTILLFTAGPVGTIFSMTLRWLVLSFFIASAFRMANKQIRGEEIDYTDLFGGGPHYVQTLIYTIIFVFGAIVGMLGLCVGIYVAYGMLFPGFALVADGENATNAAARSFDGTKSDWAMAGLFTFVYCLLIGLSTLACGLGELATYPMGVIICALAYRDMIGMPNSGGPAPLNYGAPQPGVWPPPPGSGQQQPRPDQQQDWGQLLPPDAFGQPPAQPGFGQPPVQPGFGQQPSWQQPPPPAPSSDQPPAPSGFNQQPSWQQTPPPPPPSTPQPPVQPDVDPPVSPPNLEKLPPPLPNFYEPAVETRPDEPTFPQAPPVKEPNTPRSEIEPESGEMDHP
jgi:hypothetical protein